MPIDTRLDEGRPFAKFEGVTENRQVGRTSSQSSFIKVGAALNAGIEIFNSRVAEGERIIQTAEFYGSILSWSYHVYATVTSMVGSPNVSLTKPTSIMRKSFHVFEKDCEGTTVKLLRT